MWKMGVEYEMGVILYLIYVNMSKELDIPIEIIRLIYKLAKQIPKKYTNRNARSTILIDK
jgi:hypothetical protein